MSLLRVFELHRESAACVRVLCAHHLEARVTLGWSAVDKRYSIREGERCADCARTEVTVLERKIQSNEKPDPPPPPVDPRQEKLL